MLDLVHVHEHCRQRTYLSKTWLDERVKILSLLGWLLRGFTSLYSDISAISRLGSRREPISDIVAARPGIEPIILDGHWLST